MNEEKEDKKRKSISGRKNKDKKKYRKKAKEKA